MANETATDMDFFHIECAEVLDISGVAEFHARCLEALETQQHLMLNVKRQSGGSCRYGCPTGSECIYSGCQHPTTDRAMGDSL